MVSKGETMNPVVNILHTQSSYFEEGLNQYFNCRVTINGNTKDYSLVEIDCDTGIMSFYEDTDKDPVTSIQLFKAVKVAELPTLPKFPAIENLSCPSCGQPHLDENEWSFRPHKTHLCLFCDKTFEGTVKGVSYPVVTVSYLRSLGQLNNPETEVDEVVNLVSLGWQVIGAKIPELEPELETYKVF